MRSLFEHGVVVTDGVQFYEQISSVTGEIERVHLAGRVELSSGALLDVDKWLKARRDSFRRIEVLTEVYAYEAWMPGDRERELFRYDNADDDDLASLHRHRFYTDGRQTEQTEAVPHDQMPYLSEVIEEADRIGWILRSG